MYIRKHEHSSIISKCVLDEISQVLPFSKLSIRQVPPRPTSQRIVSNCINDQVRPIYRWLYLRRKYDINLVYLLNRWFPHWKCRAFRQASRPWVRAITSWFPLICEIAAAPWTPRAGPWPSSQRVRIRYSQPSATPNIQQPQTWHL